MNRNKFSDYLTIIAAILAIIVSLISLYQTYVTRAKTEEVQLRLGKLTQATIYLGYYTKILSPQNNERFNQQYVKMDVTFGRDLNPEDHIWIVGFDGNNKYPLKKIDMAKGQRIWSANIELPHMQKWTLNVFQVDAKNSKILQAAHQSSQHLEDLNSSVFSYLGSVNVIYYNKGGN